MYQTLRAVSMKVHRSGASQSWRDGDRSGGPSMIAVPVLKTVDKNLAKQVTKILRDHGWDADHQKSYPVCEVLVRAEEVQVDSLRKILERHVERNESGVAVTLRQKLKLSWSLPQNPQADLTSEVELPDYCCLSGPTSPMASTSLSLGEPRSTSQRLFGEYQPPCQPSSRIESCNCWRMS